MEHDDPKGILIKDEITHIWYISLKVLNPIPIFF